MRRSMLGFAPALLFAVLVPSAQTSATETSTKTVLKPAASEVTGSGLVIRKVGTKHTRFAAKVTIAASSYKYLGLSKDKMGLAKVELQADSLLSPVPLKLATFLDGVDASATWVIDVIGANAPRVLPGDRVTVTVNGRLALSGLAGELSAAGMQAVLAPTIPGASAQGLAILTPGLPGGRPAHFSAMFSLGAREYKRFGLSSKTVKTAWVVLQSTSMELPILLKLLPSPDNFGSGASWTVELDGARVPTLFPGDRVVVSINGRAAAEGLATHR